jgi:predicted small lipoprotein YifL
MIKKITTVVIAVFMLAACADPLWVKPNATNADRETDTQSCQQSVVDSTSGRAGVTHCATNSVCEVDGFGPGYREQLFDHCMQSKGWSLHPLTHEWAPDWL